MNFDVFYLFNEVIYSSKSQWTLTKHMDESQSIVLSEKQYPEDSDYMIPPLEAQNQTK